MIMIISTSKHRLRKSFEKTFYTFTEKPKPNFKGNFGVYVHIPFCFSLCSFCPFYKVIYSEKLKDRYLNCIGKEIDETSLKGKAKWVYLGGGTPNTLTVEELASILKSLENKIKLGKVGIELLPTPLTNEYLLGLREVGFTKISVGVESFSDKVLRKTGRKLLKNTNLEEVIQYARSSLNFWVNVDMMVGLPNQNPDTFREDIIQAGFVRPDQITIYPYLILRGSKAAESMHPTDQFLLIEEAASILKEVGYDRKSVWTFALGDDLYDSSRDELIEDYAGFGPAAFSTYSNWKVVNPEILAYFKNFNNGKRMGFVAPKSKASDEWRKFAHMLYDLKCQNLKDFPFYIKAYILLLKLTRYSKNGKLTNKGKMLAHEITKTVVESLPFPIQNPDCVKNYEEYTAYILNSNSKNISSIIDV